MCRRLYTGRAAGRAGVPADRALSLSRRKGNARYHGRISVVKVGCHQRRQPHKMIRPCNMFGFQSDSLCGEIGVGGTRHACHFFPEPAVAAVAVGAMTDTLDSRVARLESDVANISTHVADIKVDLRELRNEVKADVATINGNLREMRSTMERRFEAVDKRFEGMNQKIDQLAIWLVSTLLGLGAAILGTMAAGFHWL